MKQIIYILGFYMLGLFMAIGQTQTENYVKTTSYQVETTDGSNTTPNQKQEGITYYDGLGRPIQSLALRSGSNQEDIITSMVYDKFGRQTKTYLPFARTTSSLDIASAVLPNDDGNIPTIDTFYLNKYPEDLDANSPNPYSEQVLEFSPLNRVFEQAAPGADWKNTGNNDHTIKFAYTTNSLNPNDAFSSTDAQGNYYDNIKRFTVNHPNADTEQTELVYQGHYQANALYKTITKDENWSNSQTHSRDHTTEEFKDKQGRVILKRTYHENIPHDTQYVYDNFGNLTYVLSPKGSDGVLARVQFKGNTTHFTYLEIGPQNVKGLVLGTGGGSVTVNPSTHQMTVDIELSFTGSYHLHQGPIKMIDSNIPNMPIGTISGSGYSYEVFIEDGYLQLSGSGLVSSLNETLTVDIPEYYVDAAVIDDLCYQYHYDYRNRLIEKKIPAKGWEYIIYDPLDRPVLTQDAVMRANNTWLFTKYDAFGRVVYTGTLLNLDDTRQAFQNRVNNLTVFVETPTTSLNSSIAGYGMYYTNHALQFTGAAISYTDLYTINYYDSYNAQLTAVAANPNTVYGQNTTTQTKSLATGSRVKVLDGTGNHWITTVTYYDDKARPIYVASKNSYLNTTDTSKTELDFVGKVVQSNNHHAKGDLKIDVHDTFTYDHTGRLLTQVQRINNGTPELIVNNQYDELGQLIRKNVGGTVATLPTQSNGLQTVDYTYNIRGWLKSINDHEGLADDLFGFKLHYNTTSLTGSKALYNGNISETLWRTSNDVNASVAQRGYSYQYDALNRITSAHIMHQGAANLDDVYNLQYTSYDKNGNILSLGRSGWDTVNQTKLLTMDALTYKYNGNQLTAVSEAGDTNHGFKAASSGYTYDVNGNMLSDTGKGITNIDYNHLNLPTQVDVGNDNIGYIYDTSGIKLRKIVTEGSSETITSYAGNFVYKEDNTGERLEFFNHPEGYIEPDEAGFNYVYQYKDHLGNIRLSYRSNAYEILANDTFEENTGVWTGSVSVDDERLKVNTTHQYSGTVLLLGSDFSTGEHIDVSFVLDTGNTDVLRCFLYETDASGNVLAYYEVNSDAQSGAHTMSHSIVAGTKLNLKFDKSPNSSDVGNTTHFFIDDVFVNKGALEIVEENNYYPFGLKHKGYNNAVSANANQVARYFRFGGKEYQQELGIGWYDITARNYDPALGRWMNLDPLAEEMRRHSPYNYAFDNPIFFIDPDGMMPFGPGDPPKKQGFLDGLKKTVLGWFNRITSSDDNDSSNSSDSNSSSNSSSSSSSSSRRDSGGGFDFGDGEGQSGPQDLKRKGGRDIEYADVSGAGPLAVVAGGKKGGKGNGKTNAKDLSKKNGASAFADGTDSASDIANIGDVYDNIPDSSSNSPATSNNNGSLNSSNTSGEVSTEVKMKIYKSNGVIVTKKTTTSNFSKDSTRIKQNKNYELHLTDIDSVTKSN